MSASGFMLVVFAVSLWSGDARAVVEPLSLDQRPVTSVPGIDHTLTCLPCRQIIQVSANMISSSQAKETVYEVLHDLCQRLPEEKATECESQIKSYLPKVLQQTPAHLKPAEVCVAFGLCVSHKEEEPQKIPPRVAVKETPNSALESGTKPHEQLNPICTLCVLFIKKLETLLPTNMTEEALRKIMGEVCDLIPKHYKEQCDDFVDKYGVAIIDFLLSSAAPHTICALLHLCLFKEQLGPVSPEFPELVVPSDCESCRTLAMLSRLHLGLNATQPQTSAFLQSVCVDHPKAIPKCESFTTIYGSQLQKVLGNQMDVPHACERTSLCAAVKKQQVEPLGQNPCTWGPSFWCKDVETAQKCGNQAFCEKYMWKKHE
ncbi:surfactant protein Bb isoform X2 [Mugil cephalus]|uniref:surfactant protein Bb isoform X2 n=1 Tax=Mugil cephalus TaxID=48193 RepID=UPI001FB5AAD9|nr:surfactant protein Bb isoform X2 [Mugil cephalus]